MLDQANALDLGIQLAPPAVADDTGVPLATHHLQLVGRDARDLGSWRGRRAPLGMSPAQFRDFCSYFFAASSADGLPANVDVRLKGSSAIIYSGPHKVFPATSADRDREFTRLNKRAPSAAEKTGIEGRFTTYQGADPLPGRRPFDSMYYLGIDTQRSDYDVQVSSRDVENRCRAILSATGIATSLHHPVYGFLDDRLVALAIPAIVRWASVFTMSLGRSVNVKAFGASGPANKTATIGNLSSHFRPHDWIVTPPIAGVD